MKNASADPNKPVELNWVNRRTSHELNSCKLVELSSAHVKYGVCDGYCRSFLISVQIKATTTTAT